MTVDRMQAELCIVLARSGKSLPAPILFAVAMVVLSGSLSAQVVRIPLPNSTFPISQGVWAGDTLYLSGMLDPNLGKGITSDTKTQTVSAIVSIQHALEAQKLSLADVVMMHVYLVGDPGETGCDGLQRIHGRLYPVLRHEEPAQQASTKRNAGRTSSIPKCSGRDRSDRRPFSC